MASRALARTFVVEVASAVDRARQILAARAFDVVVIDSRLADSDFLELVNRSTFRVVIASAAGRSRLAGLPDSTIYTDKIDLVDVLREPR